MVDSRVRDQLVGARVDEREAEVVRLIYRL
jgi:hypothetical protein